MLTVRGRHSSCACQARDAAQDRTCAAPYRTLRPLQHRNACGVPLAGGAAAALGPAPALGPAAGACAEKVPPGSWESSGEAIQLLAWLSTSSWQGEARGAKGGGVSIVGDGRTRALG